MARASKVVARQREAEALAIKVAEPSITYEELAKRVGLRSAGAAHDAVYRPIRKSVAKNVEELRELKNAQLDAMFEALWPFATNDVRTVLQWIGKGKDRRPDNCLDEPDPDDESHVHAHQICYVIPSDAMLGSVKECQSIIKQQSDLFGLKHSDGIEERRQRLEEAQFLLIVSIVQAALDASTLSPTDRSQVASLVANQLREVGQKALDTKAVKA